MSKKIDLTGKVFGRLTVIKEAGRNNSSLFNSSARCGRFQSHY